MGIIRVMSDFVLSLLIGSLMVVTTTMLFYEILGFTWALLPKLVIPLRQRILVVILAIFGGHTLAVWIYAGAYWWIATASDFGALQGRIDPGFHDYLYFSAATYSSLGIGDIVPTDGFRLVASIEVLNGLVLIGWSASFAYLVMQKFWEVHRPASENGENQPSETEVRDA